MLNYFKIIPVRLFLSSEFFTKRSKIKKLILSIFSGCYLIYASEAQTENKFDFPRIEDNSFLLEEAYNQEPGVIQHISSFQYFRNKTWLYTFTDEWPVPGRKHQLSATVQVLRTSETGLGDIAINYRYQAVLLNRLAFSPRFSLLLPTGYYRQGLGSGAPGYQLSLPVSYLLSRKIVTHYNIGVTIVPNAKNEDGSTYDLINYNYGLSMILLLCQHFNFMLEVSGNTIITSGNNENKPVFNSLLINPGFRYSIDFKSGLQIVPGIAVPIGLESLNGETWIFAYLSFEHPLWMPKNQKVKSK